MSAGALQSVWAPLSPSRTKTTTLVVEATAELAQAASLRITASIAKGTGCQLANALTRFYWLLHNSQLDDLTITDQMPTTAHPGPGRP